MNSISDPSFMVSISSSFILVGLRISSFLWGTMSFSIGPFIDSSRNLGDFTIISRYRLNLLTDLVKRLV